MTLSILLMILNWIMNPILLSITNDSLRLYLHHAASQELFFCSYPIPLLGADIICRWCLKLNVAAVAESSKFIALPSACSLTIYKIFPSQRSRLPSLFPPVFQFQALWKVTSLSPEILQIAGTFLLLLCVSAVGDRRNAGVPPGLAPLYAGLAVLNIGLWDDGERTTGGRLSRDIQFC